MFSFVSNEQVLVDVDAPRVQRLIAPYSVITRPAAGSEHRLQAIAANLDTLFVVTSCNADFNLSRLERYLAVAIDAKVDPVIMLTKMDLCDDVDVLIDQAKPLSASAAIVAVNGTRTDSIDGFVPFLTQG